MQFARDPSPLLGHGFALDLAADNGGLAGNLATEQAGPASGQQTEESHRGAQPEDTLGCPPGREAQHLHISRRSKQELKGEARRQVLQMRHSPGDANAPETEPRGILQRRQARTPTAHIARQKHDALVLHHERIFRETALLLQQGGLDRNRQAMDTEFSGVGLGFLRRHVPAQGWRTMAFDTKDGVTQHRLVVEKLLPADHIHEVPGGEFSGGAGGDPYLAAYVGRIG